MGTMKIITLETTVSVTLKFPNVAAAVAWAEEHTVFDMLDKGADVGKVTLHNEAGEIVGRVGA